MKKNNKFRNNGNSNAYSLNYKFDSISPAGKISGTALDLIKKYNELAKESHGNGDYIEMEVYRQYAEHYRKIVTEINERKNYRSEQQCVSENQNTETNEQINPENDQAVVSENVVEPIVQTPMTLKKKTFKIVEIKPEAQLNNQDNNIATLDNTDAEIVKPKRTVRRKKNTQDESKSEAV